MLEEIKALAGRFAQEFIEVRRHLHAHPELSYQEFETAEFIRNRLSSFGIPYETKAVTGVVGLIRGLNPEKRIVALRADMDALPIREENDVPYKSKKDGIMHACGHDVHTACLLGAAKILNELRHKWEGTVKLIFQPGEEKNPGGASLLIQEGVLENPRPQAILALHVHNGLPTGKLSFRSGQVMASSDEIYINIKGKGGHAAAPHAVIDPILISAHLITALQQIISRQRDPFQPGVLSITSIQGGNTTNVIPDEVKLMGTLRAMDETWRTKAIELIQKLSHEIASAMGGSANVVIDKGYPSVFNHDALTENARKKAIEYLGRENVEESEQRMGSEDFGFYAREIPACFFRLGVMNKSKGIISGVHTPTFNIDENAIEIGMGIMAWLGSSVKI